MMGFGQSNTKKYASKADREIALSCLGHVILEATLFSIIRLWAR